MFRINIVFIAKYAAALFSLEIRVTKMRWKCWKADKICAFMKLISLRPKFYDEFSGILEDGISFCYNFICYYSSCCAAAEWCGDAIQTCYNVI